MRSFDHHGDDSYALVIQRRKKFRLKLRAICRLEIFAIRIEMILKS